MKCMKCMNAWNLLQVKNKDTSDVIDVVLLSLLYILRIWTGIPHSGDSQKYFLKKKNKNYFDFRNVSLPVI